MNAGLEAGLGLILLAVILMLSVSVVVWLRRLQRNVPVSAQTDLASLSPTSSHTNEAVLIVQSGGRIEYINELAREWFGFRADELPDLERLFRRVRPLEEFIELCTRPCGILSFQRI
jgi:hypothetical protein